MGWKTLTAPGITEKSLQRRGLRRVVANPSFAQE